MSRRPRTRFASFMHTILCLGTIAACALARHAVAADAKPAANKQAPITLDAKSFAKLFKGLEWRAIGPANMGGRISDFAAVESNPAQYYVATATGGVFKTSNQGTTWSAVCDKQAVASIGAIAVCQKNPDLVWVGTGEPNGRNSSAWGNGVYRSADGGGLDQRRARGHFVQHRPHRLRSATTA